MKLDRFAALTAAALAIAAYAAPATAQSIDLAVATSSRDEISHHESFAATTPRIYVIYKVSSPKAAKLRAVWFAEKVEGEKENSKFSTADSNAGAGSFMGAFSNGKPGNGWPAGAYRVELFVDDKLEKTVRFKVTK